MSQIFIRRSNGLRNWVEKKDVNGESLLDLLEYVPASAKYFYA